MKKSLVIDGNSILNRAFYGIRPLYTKSGKPTNAIYGMLNIVLRHLEALKPDYAAVAFDLKAPNFRKQRFSYYKEGRHETPEELLLQFDDAKECLRLLGFHTLELEGYEADDILGTVARLGGEAEDTHTYVLSGDRDLLQLIDDRTTVLLASTGDTLSFDRDAFFAKYGIEPSEFVDLKALMGDSSDNIPGVPGVGEKTASRLIAEFHSIQKLYDNLDSPSIAKGVRAKLEAGKASAEDSRFLAEVCKSVPLALTLADLTYDGVCPKMYDKCRELEFSALIKKLSLVPTDEDCTEGAVAGEFSVPVPKDADEKALLAALKDVQRFAVLLTDDALLFSNGKETYRYTGALSPIASLFEGNARVVTFDGKALLHRLWKEGVGRQLVPRDLLLYAYILHSDDGSHAPDALALRYLETAIPEGESGVSLFLALEEALAKEIDKIDCRALLEKIELPLSPVLARMEAEGFRIDTAALEAFGNRLAAEMVLLTESIISLAGMEFNLNSPKQLAEVLFTHLALPTKGVKKNKNGYSTDVDTLTALRHTHPIIDEILEYRKVSKLYSTYAQGLLKVADGEGNIHTEFKQALTATGRLSSAEPNLQNIPIRTPLGRELRRVFVPKKETRVLVDADYSQIELRLMAALSKDEDMCDAFLSGTDIHRRTAAAVFHLPEALVPDDLRARAKAVNFGIIYGISAYSLSGDIGVSVGEAKRYMDDYFAMFPRIKSYLDGVIASAEEDGYTKTIFQRRRYIPELSSRIFAQRAFGKRVAMNSPIQGSAADIIKLAMVRVDRRLRNEGLDARLILQVHDELIVEADASCAEAVRQILKEEMEGAVSLAVPLTVSTAIGKNWLEAEH